LETKKINFKDKEDVVLYLKLVLVKDVIQKEENVFIKVLLFHKCGIKIVFGNKKVQIQDNVFVVKFQKFVKEIENVKLKNKL